MTDTTHEAPERIWAGKYHGTWWQSRPHHQMIEYVRADLVQAAVAAALTGAMNCCTEELYNTALLTSNPPQSSAAWHARNAILALITDDAQAALDRYVAAALREAADAVEDYCSDSPDLAGHGHSGAIRDVITAIRKRGK